MNASRFGELEVIARMPHGEPRYATPLLFIHGAYTAAWCWEETFLDYFAGLGFACYAVSLSGHGQSRRKGQLDQFSLEDYVADVDEVARNLPRAPALIGHSMGGMVVQKYLEKHPSAGTPAAVLLCSVPPHGLLGAAFGLMLRKPSLLIDLNRIMGGGQPDLQTVREALFHQPIDTDVLRRYASLAQPESHRAIWDMTLFNLPVPALMKLPPLLIMGAEHDRLIPPALVHLTALSYHQHAHIIPGLGHGVMLERDWKRAAEPIAHWLAQQLG